MPLKSKPLSKRRGLRKSASSKRDKAQPRASVPSTAPTQTEKELPAETQRADEQLRQTQARLANILENSSEAIVALNSRHNIIVFNQAAEKMFGYTAKEILGRPLDQLMPGGLIEIHRRHVQAFAASPGKNKQMAKRSELAARRKDGIMFPVEIGLSKLVEDSEVVFTAMIVDVTERKRAEEALQESEARFRSLTEMISDYAYAFDILPNGMPKGTWLTDAFTRVFSLTLEEIDARGGLFGIVYPDDLPIAQAHYQKVLAGESDVCEMRFVTASGEPRWLRDYARPVWDETHQHVVRIFGASQDITERKRAEEELRASEERYRLLFENSGEAILFSQSDGTVYSANPEACRIFGRSEDEIKKIGRAGLVDRNDPRLQALLEERLRTGKFKGELNFVRQDGTIFPGEISTMDFKDSLGNERTSIIFRDLTERKRTEDALRESEKEFHSLAEAMPQMVWITRPDGWNIYFSQQWMDYTGLTLAESYGHGWNKPFHPDDQQRAWDAWQIATKNNSTYSLECRLRRADGVYTWWLIRGVPLLDAQGTILKWFGTCTDINELKQSESELNEQIAELQRWHDATLGRETRVLDLKREVNELLGQSGKPLRYASAQDPKGLEDL